jgi:hypothetical protein
MPGTSLKPALDRVRSILASCSQKPSFHVAARPVQTKIKPYPKHTTTVIGAHSVPDWYEKVPPRSRGAWRNTASASLPAHARLIRVNLSSPIID